MSAHLILLVISVVLLLLAAFFEWTWRVRPSAYSHLLGWLGIAAFVAASAAP